MPCRNLAPPHEFWRREIEAATLFPGIIGRSPVMQTLAHEIHLAAKTGQTVLIYGPTGSGKELIARAVHENSARRRKKFVAVNCAGLAASLLESELFGHKKGAFTGAGRDHHGVFETADNGTLFLDEIGELTLPAQAALLRALEYGLIRPVGAADDIKVNVWLLAATHRDLVEMVADGLFRADLFHRLYVTPIRVPDLREREADIDLLAWRFALQAAEEMAKPLSDIEPAVLADLRRQEWPGQVRELRYYIRRLVMRNRTGVLSPADRPPLIFGSGYRVDPASGELVYERPGQPASTGPEQTGFYVPEVIPLDEEIRRYVAWAMTQCGNIRKETAEKLGISRDRLRRYVEAKEDP